MTGTKKKEGRTVQLRGAGFWFAMLSAVFLGLGLYFALTCALPGNGILLFDEDLGIRGVLRGGIARVFCLELSTAGAALAAYVVIVTASVLLLTKENALAMTVIVAFAYSGSCIGIFGSALSIFKYYYYQHPFWISYGIYPDPRFPVLIMGLLVLSRACDLRRNQSRTLAVLTLASTPIAVSLSIPLVEEIFRIPRKSLLDLNCSVFTSIPLILIGGILSSCSILSLLTSSRASITGPRAQAGEP